MKPVVMVIDDDQDIVNLLIVILKSSGYDVVSASNAITALSLLEDNISPDLIITDYCMPRLNGCELIERIYSKNSLKDIPAVLITGSDLTSMDLPQTDNFKGLINKPFKVSTVLRTINALLKEKSYGSSTLIS